MCSGLKLRWMPISSAITRTPITWAIDRTPAANALPVISADAGDGVTISLARMPASRSQTIWMP